MEVYTIGFTKSSAADFFGRLKAAGIKQLLDVRLNNSSQLAGFAKREDLPFFLHQLVGAEYLHELRLAPTQSMLDQYKKSGGSWENYEQAFLHLMRERQIESRLGRGLFDIPTALLCSEKTAQHCHRRLVLEYLQNEWDEMEIIHL